MKKIVITGIGMVTPVGNGKDASWSAPVRSPAN